MLFRIVMAVDRPVLQRQLVRLSSELDAVVDVVRGRRLILERIARSPGDLVIVSRPLLQEPVLESLLVLRQLPDAPAVLMLTEADSSEEQARLLAAGCEAVLSSALPALQVVEVVSSILERRRAAVEKTLRARAGQPQLADFGSASPVMQAFMSLVQRVGGSEVTLLILGETGVGKEHLARAIHGQSPRAGAPFVAVNCGALPETLLESELFGHEEGAFTGATRTRRGAFEQAHRGTLFLDEVGEMPLHLQVKLLRALQEHQIQRLGSERPMSVDVRLMAATNRDVVADVEAKRFRRDLYFRLGVVTLSIPSLRERQEDIPALATRYVNQVRPRLGRGVTGISAEAMDALVKYSWPGNVRELNNVLERAMLLCSGSEITLPDLPQAMSGQTVAAPNGSLAPGRGAGFLLTENWWQTPWRQVRQEILGWYEREYLSALLLDCDGRIGETARRAGMEPRSLYEKMKRHGLTKEQFQPALPRTAAGPAAGTRGGPGA